MDFISYCRLCATFTPEVDLIDIFGNKNGLELKIEQCFQLKIENDNFLPKQACIVCSSKVHSFYDFVIQVQKAQLVFNKSTNQVPILVETKIEVEDDIDAKFELNNSNSSDKFSDNYKGGQDYGGDETDEDFEKGISDIKFESKELPTRTVCRTTKSNKRKKGKENYDEESVSDIERMKETFHKKLGEMSVKSNSHLISDEMYARLIREVEEAEAKTTLKLAVDYRRVRRYEILKTDNGVKKLIARRNKSTDKIQYFVPKSEMFELIREAHIKCNHGARKRTEHILKMKYKNLSRDLISAYLILCTVCQKRKKSIIERNKLKIENQEKTESKPPPIVLKCNDCGEIFHSANDLRDHFETVHNKPVEFVCLECSKLFNNYITFRNHLWSHKNKYRFRCDVCEKFFANSKILREHKQRHNKIRKKYFCSKCGKGFLNERYLAIHTKRPHSTNDKQDVPKPYACDECHKMFASISSLNNHKKVHTGVRDHTCEHCGKSFFYKKYLDDHITTHSKDRPFKCDTCTASFRSKMLLRQHVFLHTGVKPFQCQVCGKKFPRKPALIEHSIVHTDLYPFKCEICDKSFRSKRNVDWHQRLHTGEKPYSCETCNRHFTCTWNYNVHMKRVHGIVKMKKEVQSEQRSQSDL